MGERVVVDQLSSTQVLMHEVGIAIEDNGDLFGRAKQLRAFLAIKHGDYDRDRMSVAKQYIYCAWYSHDATELMSSARSRR